MIDQTVGEELKHSVFGLHPLSEAVFQREHPLRTTAKAFVSDRYAEVSGGIVQKQQKILFPFAVDVDPAALETWQLKIGDSTATTPIPHPGATLLNYLTRSISGIRPKDMDKVVGTAEKVGLATKVLGDPELRQWVYDGPGKPLWHLARVLHGLRQPIDDQRSLRLTEKDSLVPIHPERLVYDQSFMFATEAEELGMKAAFWLSAARAKSRVVHFGERQEKVVDVWQRKIEPLIGKIVFNK